MYKKQVQMNFNEYVKVQAKALLDEVKSNCSTYGEIKMGLQNLVVTSNWIDGSPNHFLIVKEEAERQLKQEIDATTHSGAITSTEIK